MRHFVLIKWLYPGMAVKRWVGLAAISMLAIIVGILGLLGKDIVRYIYGVFSPTALYSYLLAFFFIIAGASGAALGINMFLKSLIRGIAPEVEGQTAEVIYSKRRLSRGPSIVALGGGTGLSSVLRGLKEFTTNVTAVVAVMDDGGSSGRLRREINILPPGDIRNCLIALANDESRIAELFQHRFNDSSSLNGHSLGNLVIAGLRERTGRFDRAIEETSHILNIRGQVLPATLENVDLMAEMEDGELIRGERNLAEDPRRIKRILLSKERVAPYQKVLDEIKKAQIIVLGPGSLFTSIIPNLLVEGVAKEIEEAKAKRFYIVNLMTQPGETDGFTAFDHLKVLNRYINISKFDCIIVNREVIPEDLMAQYKLENSTPVENDLKGSAFDKAVRAYQEVPSPSFRLGLKVLEGDLLDVVELESKRTIKHNSQKLAKLIIEHSKSEFEKFFTRS